MLCWVLWFLKKNFFNTHRFWFQFCFCHFTLKILSLNNKSLYTNTIWLRLRSDLLTCRYRKYTKLLLHLTHPFNRLAPVEHTRTCTGSHTHGDRRISRPDTGAVGSHSQRPGSMGVRCLAQGPLGRGKGLLPLQVSVHQSLSGKSWNRTTNHPVIGFS